jgi:hypothetical protein
MVALNGMIVDLSDFFLSNPTGANQAIQDAYSLAQRIRAFNENVMLYESASGKSEEKPPNLNRILRQYQNVRFSPTASITIKAAILGYLETGGRNGFYGKVRDIVFRILDLAGVPKKVLVSFGRWKLRTLL